jgi:hypothetical protein
MFSRRLLAGLLVLGVAAGHALPLAAQDKEKGKGKDKGKEDKGGDKTTLKWKFEKDKVFYQKMTTETTQTMNVLNNNVTQKQKQTFYFSWKPTRVEQDKVTLEQTIIGVQMDIDIGGSKIAYDSTKDTTANNPLGDFFKALVGSKFTVTLNTKDYKVTDIEGREDFIKKLTTANPQMKPLLETILSKEALKEMAEPTFAVIPTSPVSKGEKWKKETTLEMGPIGKYTNSYTYTYDGKGDKKLDRIRVATSLKYTPPSDSQGQGGLPFKIKGADLKSTSASGEILFDNAKGRVEGSKMKLELKGNLQIEIGGSTTKVELSQTQDSSVETLDKDPIEKKK